VSYSTYQVKINDISADEALAFWAASAQASPFTHPAVLSALSKRVDFWGAFVDGTLMCVWPVCENHAGIITAPEFSYYVGPFWADKAIGLSARKSLYLFASVYDAYLRQLLLSYGAIKASLLPELEDLRGFQWFVRSRPLAQPLLLIPRYTAVIDRLQERSELELLAGFANTRRNKIRGFLRDGAPASCTWKVHDCLRLYQGVMQRQNESALFERRVLELEALCVMVQEGFGFVRAYALDGSQEVASFRLVLTAKSRSCDVLSMSNETALSSQLSTWLVYQSLLASRAAGAKMHDFNGANSLSRAADVHSYGADALLYCNVSARSI